MNKNKDKKTWDERLLDVIINGFFFGLTITILDLSGIDLSWETGVGVMVISLIVAVISLLIGGIVWARKVRNKTDG